LKGLFPKKIKKKILRLWEKIVLKLKRKRSAKGGRKGRGVEAQVGKLNEKGMMRKVGNR